MTDLDVFKAVMQKTTDERFNDTLTKAVLHLTDSQIEAVSFVFWLVYIAETDLNEIINAAWKLATSQQADPAAQKIAEAEIKNMLMGEKKFKDNLEEVVSTIEESVRTEILGIVQDHYQSKRDIDIGHLDYFIDKIRVIEGLSGKTSLVKLLWKLNDLRNKISHGEIDALEYERENLQNRPAREHLLLDFLSATMSADAEFEKSPFASLLTDEQKAAMEAGVEVTMQKIRAKRLGDEKTP